MKVRDGMRLGLSPLRIMTVGVSLALGLAAQTGVLPTEPVGQTSAPVAVPIVFSSATTLKTIAVVTTGYSGRDYALGTGTDACTTGSHYGTGASCDVYVSFTPAAPGLRLGAIKLTSSSGTVLIQNLSGVGTGAMVSFSPGTAAPVAASLNTVSAAGCISNGNGGYTVGPNAVQLVSGLTYDSAGNLYVADYGNERLLKVPVTANGTLDPNPNDVQVLLNDLTCDDTFGPAGLAVDGAGNLYIADYLANRIYEMNVTDLPASPVNLAGQPAANKLPATVSLLVSENQTTQNLSSPNQIAVDGNGNLVVANYACGGAQVNCTYPAFTGPYDGSVWEIPSQSGRLNPSAMFAVAAPAGGWIGPCGAVFDANDNLYVSDFTTGAIVKIANSGGSAKGAETLLQAPNLGGTGFGAGLGYAPESPNYLAFDPAGNLYVADYSSQQYVEVPNLAGTLELSAATLLGTSNGNAIALALDAAGNVIWGDQSSANLTLLQRDAGAFAFGNVPLHQTPTLVRALTNTGNAALNLTAVTLDAGDVNFALAGGTTCAAGSVVNPNVAPTSCNLAVTFTSRTLGPAPQGTVTLTDNNLNVNGATQAVSLTATGAPDVPVISWTSPASITYGTPLGGQQLDATASVPGTFEYAPAAGAILGAGTQTLSVTFVPTDNVDYTSANATVTLTVTQATPVLTWPAPAAIVFGSALSATQLDATANVPGSFVYRPFLGQVIPAGTQTLAVTFTPADTTDYTSASDATTITVTQATPTITWPAPAPIAFPTPLSATQLDAVCSVGCQYDYAPTFGTVLAPGVHTLNLLITPFDTTDYTTATATTMITVTKGTPVITWPAPAPILYGTVLGPAQLDATATIQGSFAYSPAAGTLLAPGVNQTLSVTFTPADTTDYVPVTVTTPITVNKLTPTVSWPAPLPIPYGTPLGGAQLDATANVAGTMAYTPGPGTVLHAGANQLLSATFTPTDAVHYATVTATTTLTVTPLTPTVSWSSPAPIVYGTPLSGLQLDATASTTGTFTYTPGAGAVLNAGVDPLSVTFNPADATDYNAVTTSVSIAVAPAPQMISFPAVSAPPYLGAPVVVTLGAVDNAGLPISYSVTGPATVSGNTLTISGPGPVTVTASVTQASPNWTPAVPVTVTVAVSPLGYVWGLYASSGSCNALQMSGNAVVDSFNSSLGPYPVTRAGGGNIGSNGSVDLDGNAQVFGALYDPHGPTVQPPNCPPGATATGTFASGGDAGHVQGGVITEPSAVTFVAPAAPLPAPPTSTQNLGPYCGNVNGCAPGLLNVLTLAPGTYGNIIVHGNVILTLTAGTYNFNSLTVADNGVIHLGSGPVIVNLAGAGMGAVLNFGSGASIDNPGLAGNLVFEYAGSGAIDLNCGATAAAVVYAPNAAVTLSGNADFFGAIVAATINVAGDARIHYDQALAQLAVDGAGTAATGAQPQTISFAPAATETFPSLPILLSATASSGLPVSFSVTSGPGVMIGPFLLLTGPGTVTVTATQAGNLSFAAALPVTESIVVTLAPPFLGN